MPDDVDRAALLRLAISRLAHAITQTQDPVALPGLARELRLTAAEYERVAGGSDSASYAEAIGLRRVRGRLRAVR